MNRRRKRQRRSSEVTFSRPLTARLLGPLPSSVRFQKSHAVAVEDRRTHHPLGFFRPARQWSGHPVQPNVVSKNSVGKQAKRFPVGIRFADPRRTLICVRRKQRKEVLFAKRKTGKGARARHRRRNYFSEVSC